jgi:NAD+ kinase
MFSNTINIYSNDNKKSIGLKNKLLTFFHKMKVSVDDKSSNIIVIGGDGTFINAFNKYGMKNAKLFLINTGCIGFYSSFNANFSINKILKFFQDEKNFYYPDIIKCETNTKKYYGINELFINSSGVLKTDISINNNKYESFFGSGLCFCTITGSTGLNKSLGGSIFLTRKRL